MWAHRLASFRCGRRSFQAVVLGVLATWFSAPHRAMAQFRRRILARRIHCQLEDVITQMIVMLPAMMVLAVFEAIGRELQLKAEELKKLEPLRNEFRRDLFASIAEVDFPLADLAAAPTEEGERRWAASRGKMGEVAVKLNEKYDDKLRGLLTEEQRFRLRQLAWQFAGGRALLDPRIAEPLGLTAAQKQQVEAILNEYEMRRKRFLLAETKSAKEVGDDIEAQRTARDEQARAVLTAPQQVQLQELLGKPVDVAGLRRQAFSGAIRTVDGAQGK